MAQIPLLLVLLFVTGGFSLPQNYDPRTDLPTNLQKCIHPIRDQFHLRCGSCWAHAASEVLSDRLCIHSNGVTDHIFSVQHLLDCDKTNNGCGGGTAQNSFAYLWAFGDIEESCQPYNVTVQTCRQTCIDGSTPQRYYMDRLYKVPMTDESVMNELYTNGPVSALLSEFTDFAAFRGSGVYSPAPTATFFTGHFIKIIGYGTTPEGEAYWLIANSFGTEWGDNGFGKIKRGTCDLTLNVVTGMPRLTPTAPSVPSIPLPSPPHIATSGSMVVAIQTPQGLVSQATGMRTICDHTSPQGLLWRADVFPDGAAHPIVVVLAQDKMYIVTTLFEELRCSYLTSLPTSFRGFSTDASARVLPTGAVFQRFGMEGAEGSSTSTLAHVWKAQGNMTGSPIDIAYSLALTADFNGSVPLSVSTTLRLAAAGNIPMDLTYRVASTMVKSVFSPGEVGTLESILPVDIALCHPASDLSTSGINPVMEAALSIIRSATGCDATIVSMRASAVPTAIAFAILSVVGWAGLAIVIVLYCLLRKKQSQNALGKPFV